MVHFSEGSDGRQGARQRSVAGMSQRPSGLSPLYEQCKVHKSNGTTRQSAIPRGLVVIYIRWQSERHITWRALSKGDVQWM
jgi:hypothetical protein